jgi:hypothetical protein
MSILLAKFNKESLCDCMRKRPTFWSGRQCGSTIRRFVVDDGRIRHYVTSARYAKFTVGYFTCRARAFHPQVAIRRSTRPPPLTKNTGQSINKANYRSTTDCPVTFHNIRGSQSWMALHSTGLATTWVMAGRTAYMLGVMP